MNRPSNSRRGQIALILGFLFCALAGAQSNYVKETYRHIFLSLIDSTPIGQTTPAAVNTTALTVNGAAASAHTLVGTGTAYADYAAPTSTDVTGSRSFGTAFTNTGLRTMIVSGYGTTGGSSTGARQCLIGPSTPTISAWGDESTATVNSGYAGFFCPVPPGWEYEITVAGSITGPTKWIETE